VYKQDWTQSYDPGRTSYSPFSVSGGLIVFYKL